MKSTTDKINNFLHKFREQKAAEIGKLQSKVDAIEKQLEEKAAELVATNAALDFEKAYTIKKDIDSIAEEKEFYLNGINRIKANLIIDETNFNAMNNEARAEDLKAETETIKKVYAMLDEVFNLVTAQSEKRRFLTRAVEELAAEAGVEIVNPIGNDFYNYILANLEFMTDGSRNMYENGGSFYD